MSLLVSKLGLKLVQVWPTYGRSSSSETSTSVSSMEVGSFQALCGDPAVHAAFPEGILWSSLGKDAIEADIIERMWRG